MRNLDPSRSDGLRDPSLRRTPFRMTGQGIMLGMKGGKLEEKRLSKNPLS